MPLQMRVGEIRYAPSRDVVYLYPSVLSSVAARLEDAPFQPLHEWLDREGVSLDDLGEAMGAYSRYMNMAHQDPDKKMMDVLLDSGWEDCKWQARVAVMFYTGIMMTGTFFQGVRDVVPEGGETVTPVLELQHAAKRLDWFIAMPAWQRSLYRKYKWIRNLLHLGRGIPRET